MRKVVFTSEEYNDNFQKIFQGNYNGQVEMKEFINNMVNQSKWKKIPLSNTKALSVAGGPLFASQIREKYALPKEIDDLTIISTIIKDYSYGCIGANMILEHVNEEEKNYYLFSGTGLMGYIQRAGAYCSAINKLPLESKEKIINECLTVAEDKEALFLQRFGKIIAVNGASKYVILEQNELFNVLESFLDEEYFNNVFGGGFYTHSLTSCKWHLYDQTEKILEEYNTECKKRGFVIHDFTPAIEFITSDIGSYAATISAKLICKNLEIMIGSPIKIPHMGDASINKFKDSLPKLFTKFQDLVTKMTELFDIEIHNPINNMLHLGLNAGIQRTALIDAVDLFKATYVEGNSCKAYDIFMALHEGLYNMTCDGKTSPVSILKCEENLSRLVTSKADWKKYDISVAPKL